MFRLIAFTLLFLLVSARNIGLQLGNLQPGGKPEENQFLGGNPLTGGHNFPENYEFLGSSPDSRLSFFPIFKNITLEARMELLKILLNYTLTKAETETELKAWATEQGADVEKQLADILEKEQKMKEDFRAKVNEVLEEVKAAIERVEEIRDNMDITKIEEMKQIFGLFQNMTKTIPVIIGLVTETAMKGLIPTPELPTALPPIEPSAIPIVRA